MQMLEPVVRGDVEMMAAFLADHLERFEFLVENIGAALGALRPQALGHFLLFRRRFAVIRLGKQAAGGSKGIGHDFVKRRIDSTPGNGQDRQLARPGFGQGMSAGINGRACRKNIVYN